MMTLIGQLADAAKRSFIKFMARPRKSRSTTKRRKQSSIEVEIWQQRCYELARENERLKIEAQDARQQLCQLRIDGGAYGEGVHKRIGYMIGTFIPEGALEKLRKHPERVAEFKQHVLEAMVNSAINKMLHVNDNGKQVAMIFLPHGAGDKTKRANIPVFETSKGFQMIVPEKLQHEIDKVLEYQAQEERRKLLQY